MELRYWVSRAVDVVERWGERFGPYTRHPSQLVEDAVFAPAFDSFAKRMANNYPFFHPRYAGQMLKPPHPAAVVGYLTAMLVNPNNHALDGGPATAEMEREVVASARRHVRPARAPRPPDHQRHHREPGGAVRGARNCTPTGAWPTAPKPTTRTGGCAACSAWRVTRSRSTPPGGSTSTPWTSYCATGQVGTVVVTAGTTGLGAVDPIHEVLAARPPHGARVHVDAAYGGFFTLLAGPDAEERLDPRPWQAIAGCDSVVVDPHKHGLQPYGCGAVLFADPDGRAVLRCTTRRTPTSPPTSCTSARSAWSAPGPARPRPRCG